jgi:hypothetical protein
LIKHRAYDFDEEEEEEEDDDEEETLSPLEKLDAECGVTVSKEGRYFQRLVYQAVPEYNPGYLHELNYEERKGAMYVLYSTKFGDALPTTRSCSSTVFAARVGQDVITNIGSRNDYDCNSLLVWLLLRERGSRELHQSVLSFL